MYTECNLTYTSDKLVAIFGIAKILEERLDDEYYARFWSSCLATELYWWPLRPLSQGDFNTYRAPPSCSWACQDYGIKSGVVFGDWTSLIEVIHCGIQTATADSTGAVIDGTLRLSCWLATIRFEWSEDPEKYTPDATFNGKIQCMKPGSIDPPFESSKLHCLSLTAGPNTFWEFRCFLIFFSISLLLGLRKANSEELHMLLSKRMN